jgi:hypothetical protein
MAYLPGDKSYQWYLSDRDETQTCRLLSSLMATDKDSRMAFATISFSSQVSSFSCWDVPSNTSTVVVVEVVLSICSCNCVAGRLGVGCRFFVVKMSKGASNWASNSGAIAFSMRSWPFWHSRIIVNNEHKTSAFTNRLNELWRQEVKRICTMIVLVVGVVLFGESRWWSYEVNAILCSMKEGRCCFDKRMHSIRREWMGWVRPEDKNKERRVCLFFTDQ